MALAQLPGISHRRVIGASALGALFEWYDFFMYGSLAVLLGKLFFPPGDPTTGFLSSLATFGAGFVVRPFGSLLFGRLGDLLGRKPTFLLTLLIMGGSTLLVGLLPTYGQIGAAAPAMLMGLRLIQGLALGGEYGGAATVVAEHAPPQRRGFATSWIQITTPLGFLLSLAVILSVRLLVGEAAFTAWGWRVPFLASSVLLAVSLRLRLRLEESPAFSQLKRARRLSSTPLRDAFGNRRNRRLLLLSLLGITAGQGVVSFTIHFYALFFLQHTLNVESVTAYLLVGSAMLIGTPLIVFFGALSDRIGAQPIMVTGMGLAAIGYLPLFRALTRAVNPHHPQPFDPALLNGPLSVALLTMMMIMAAMLYGPVTARLVDLFPTEIRYTSISLPFHLGNGWFGGLLPLIAAFLVIKTGNIYAGLYYPIGVCVMSILVSLIFLRPKRNQA
jgi:MFS family permease